MLQRFLLALLVLTTFNWAHSHQRTQVANPRGQLSVYSNGAIEPEPEDQKLFTGDNEAGPREEVISDLAIKEANLSRSNLSYFARMATKFPESWVRQFMNTSRYRKKYRFNFQGSAFNPEVLVAHHRRTWVRKFVDANFGEADYLRYTDAPTSYMPQGVFDHTQTPGGFRPRDLNISERGFFDTNYFVTMAESNFTLCPGGDVPWSMRFYEAAMTGTIPVIYDIKEDANFKPAYLGFWIGAIGYSSFRISSTGPGQSLEFDQSAADKNLALFIRYQTFIEGDNIPPGYPHW